MIRKRKGIPGRYQKEITELIEPIIYKYLYMKNKTGRWSMPRWNIELIGQEVITETILKFCGKWIKSPSKNATRTA